MQHTLNTHATNVQTCTDIVSAHLGIRICCIFYDTLKHTATHCSTLQYYATQMHIRQDMASAHLGKCVKCVHCHVATLQHTATHWQTHEDLRKAFLRQAEWLNKQGKKGNMIRIFDNQIFLYVITICQSIQQSNVLFHTWATLILKPRLNTIQNHIIMSMATHHKKKCQDE